MIARSTLCAAGVLVCALASTSVQAQSSRNPTAVSTHIARWANWTQRALIESRRERDVVRTRCLDDRLSELHAFERNARQHERALSSTKAREARRARASLRLNYLGARDTFNEARRCGGSRHFDGGMQIRFWVDPRVVPYHPQYPGEALPVPPHATRY